MSPFLSQSIKNVALQGCTARLNLDDIRFYVGVGMNAVNICIYYLIISVKIEIMNLHTYNCHED